MKHSMLVLKPKLNFFPRYYYAQSQKLTPQILPTQTIYKTMLLPWQGRVLPCKALAVS